MAKQIVEIRGARELKKSLERIEKRAAVELTIGSQRSQDAPILPEEP